MPIKPDRLSHGDTIGIASPASPPRDPKAIDRAVAALENLGFRTTLGPNARRRWGFLAGDDRDRAADLMQLFSDPKVDAIFCLRAGYGTCRLLPRLDYANIRRHPKVFVGYSDITSLHLAFLKRANLVSFHGPMLHSDFLNDQMPDFTLEGFLRTVTQAAPAGSVSRGYAQKTARVLREGKASGRLLGGNLTLLCASLGTPYQPSFRGKILFFEDVNEPPYRFDRLLTQLLNAGRLQQVKGIGVGVNHQCRDPKARGTREFRQTVEDVLAERLLPLGVPVVLGLPFGHVPHNATLPLGVEATLDAEAGDLLIDEAAVR
jgi:muramoyltetrapeptide carboxypeptidase